MKPLPTDPGREGQRRPLHRALAGRPVLVLGAAGYLGQHICTAFAAAGAQVIRVARRDGTAGAVRLDLAAAGSAELARLCATSGAQVVVNAAGVVWRGDDEQMTELNARLVERLADALPSLPRRPRLIQIGSVYEYGPVGPNDLIDEDWPPAPATAYGRTKLEGTRTVVHAVREQGLDGVVLRVSVACGPGAPAGSLSGTVAAHLAAGHDVMRLAPLRAHRDLVDVRDVADAVVAAARLPAPALAEAEAVINIGRGESVPVREFVDLMITCSGRSVRVQEKPGRGHRSDALWQRLDVSRARRLLGWAPRRTLTDSVCDLLVAAGVHEPDLPHGSNSAKANGRGKDKP